MLSFGIARDSPRSPFFLAMKSREDERENCNPKRGKPWPRGRSLFTSFQRHYVRKEPALLLSSLRLRRNPLQHTRIRGFHKVVLSWIPEESNELEVRQETCSRRAAATKESTPAYGPASDLRPRAQLGPLCARSGHRSPLHSWLKRLHLRASRTSFASLMREAR